MIAVLSQFSDCVERASVDEAYIDLSQEVDKRLAEHSQVTASQLPNTFVVGWDGDGMFCLAKIIHFIVYIHF